MNLDVVHELIKLSLWEGLVLMAPIMLVALAVGLLFGVIQTVTSVQEQTLTFVPKLLATAAVLWVLSPWMLHRMTTFTELFVTRAGDIMR